MPRAPIIAAALMPPTLCLADAPEVGAQNAATRWDEADNRDDMDALGKFYPPDAIVVTKGTMQSRDGIQKYFSGLKAKGWDDHKTVVKASLPKDNLLIVSGLWEMTWPAEGGNKKKFEGNWVNVLERQNGGLRTVLHTWNGPFSSRRAPSFACRRRHEPAGP